MRRDMDGAQGFGVRALVVAFALAGCGCTKSRPEPSGGGAVWNPNGPGTEAPCADGETRDCHVDLGVHDGVRTCFGGKQDCRAGVWSECQGNDVTLTSMKTSAHAGGGSGVYQVKSLSDASTAAIGCTNPCDPGCVGWDETPDGGLTAVAEAGSEGGTVTGGWFGYAGNAPPGFFRKMTCAPPSSPTGFDCNVAASYSCDGQPHCTKFNACQDDYHCESSGSCVSNGAGWRWGTDVCPSGPDLTIGVSCLDASGKEGFTLCNRGNDPLDPEDMSDPTVYFALSNGNSFGWSCPDKGCPTNKETCGHKLTAPLRPGECIRITEDEPCFATNWLSGNTTIQVDPQQRIAECGTGATTPHTNPGCSNNWADIKKGGAACSSLGAVYSPVTYTFTYDAVCPLGKHVQWNKLAFSAVTPCGNGGCEVGGYSSVTFEAQTQSRLADGGFGSLVPSTPALVAQAPKPPFTHESICTMTGPTPECPADLFTALGGAAPATTNERLSFRITLLPSTDKTAIANVDSWNITYSCKDAE